MSKMRADPGLEEIRRVRHEISAEVGHDPKRLLEYYRKTEEDYADRLVHSEEGVSNGHDRPLDETNQFHPKASALPPERGPESGRRGGSSHKPAHQRGCGGEPLRLRTEPYFREHAAPLSDRPLDRAGKGNPRSRVTSCRRRARPIRQQRRADLGSPADSAVAALPAGIDERASGALKPG